MRKQLLASAALILGAGVLASPSVADVTVTGYIDKDVTIRISEGLTKTKTVFIDVQQDFLAGESAAEAVGVHNQRVSNTVHNRNYGEDGPTPTDPGASLFPTVHTALIGFSFNGNAGIVLWNQDVGQFNNQANLVSVAAGF